MDNMLKAERRAEELRKIPYKVLRPFPSKYNTQGSIRTRQKEERNLS